MIELIDDAPSSAAGRELADPIKPKGLADPSRTFGQGSVQELQDRRGYLLRKPLKTPARLPGEFDLPTLRHPGGLSWSSDDRIRL